jgi:hypothetical protein
MNDDTFGDRQKNAFSRAFADAPVDADHLFASGSTIAGYQRYARDLAWLYKDNALWDSRVIRRTTWLPR